MRRSGNHFRKAIFSFLITGVLLLSLSNRSSAYVVENTLLEANPGSTGLVSWWSLNETGGTRNDCYGSNHLTDNNTVTYGSGKQGNAASFAAGNLEYLSIADNPSLSMGNIDFTIGGWVNLSTLGSLRTLIGKGASNGANKNFEYFLEYVPSVNKFYFGIGNGTTYGEVTSTSPSTSVWYFLVAWYDSSADTMYLQVNDGTPASAAYTGGSHDNSNMMTIGKLSGYNGGYFNGSIHEVFIYKRVLTADERAWLYNSGNGRTCSDLSISTGTPEPTPTSPGTTSLVSWWSLDQTSGERNDSHSTNILSEHYTVGASSGKQGNAASFTTADYLDIGDNASLSMGENIDFTIGGWVNLNALSATYQTIIAKGGGTNANTAFEYFLEYENDTGKFYFNIGNGMTYGEVVNTIPTTSTWYFLVAWYNSGTDTMYLQVNNGIPASAYYADGSYDSPYNLAIGRLGGYNGGYLNGLADEVFIYKRILTDGERTWLYNSGDGRTYADLLPPPTATPTLTPTSTPTLAPTSTPTATPTPRSPNHDGSGTCWQSFISWEGYTVYYSIDRNTIPVSKGWDSSIHGAAQAWNDVAPSPFQFVFLEDPENSNVGIFFRKPLNRLSLAEAFTPLDENNYIAGAVIYINPEPIGPNEVVLIGIQTTPRVRRIQILTAALQRSTFRTH